MRYTLLELTQLLLSSLDSDEVNSISDTVESTQIALLLKSVYYDLAIDLGLPEHETLVQLEASQDPAKPCVMQVPSRVVTLKDIKYDMREDTDEFPNYQDVPYKCYDDFIKWIDFYKSIEDDDTGVQEISFNGEHFPFPYRMDRQPECYMVADDQQIIFNSYRADIENTLQKSKTMCKAVVYPEFILSDSFTPDLDPSQFSFFINRAKVRAFNELKQQANDEAAYEARRQKIIVQKRKRKTPDGPELWKTPRYGR